MGRYYWDKKDTVEDCRSVSISFLKRHDYFCGSRSGRIVWKNSDDEEVGSIGVVVSVMDGDNYARLYYTITDLSKGDETEYDYKIKLTTTPCHFGGIRYWFICPLSVGSVPCGRRVAKLYRAPNADYYGCRHCYDLTYQSRNDNRRGTWGLIGYYLNRAEKLEEQENNLKRRFYRGRPTKKYRRILSQIARLNAYSGSIEAFFSGFGE